MKNISILGSTGSIGTQTLEVVDILKDIKVIGISGNENIDLLEKQAIKYKPKYVAVMNTEKSKILENRLAGLDVKVLSGMEGLIEVATESNVDTVVTSVVGNIGLKPTFEAVNAGKNIALANKETLASAGQLFMDLVNKKGVSVYPVDSEHSAIYQCLQNGKHGEVKKIILTASGGPFRGKNLEYLKNVTVAEALKHPNWSMGRKITIDSATLMNKGLEVMEAKWLFNVDCKDIEVVVHPQSIIHSAVEYVDGVVMAQLGSADMRIPIQYGLTAPERYPNEFKKLDFTDLSNLTFEKPDIETFKCLGLAYKALEIGGTIPTVLNGANDVAVSRFLAEEIKFLDIPLLIEEAMNAYTVKYNYNLEDLLEADSWAREFASKYKV